MVEERPGEGLPPRLQHRLQRAAIQIWAQPVIKQQNNAAPSHRRIHDQVGRTAEAGDERAGHVQLHHCPIPLELPGRKRAAWEPPEQAGMGQQVAGMLRASVAVQVSRGRGIKRLKSSG